MGIPVGRVGDVGVCFPKPGINILMSGAPTVISNGLPTANASTIGVTTLGTTTTVTAMSVLSNAAGGGIHRLGELGVHGKGMYLLTAGSPTVLAG